VTTRRWKLLLLLTLLPVGVGLASSLIAQAFVAAVIRANELLLIAPAARDSAPADVLIAATILVPAAGGLLVGLLRHFAGAHRIGGPAEVIATVQTRTGGIDARSGLASAAGGLLSIGSGATVGEYGPLVHMGGSVGAALARFFRTDVTVINIAIACGVAAAISTVFNAPLAGILFAHEIILRHFAPRAFAPVAVASIVGYIVGNALRAREPMLAAEQLAAPHLWEFGLLVALGLAGAAVAIGFMHAILSADRMARRIRRLEWLKPAAAGLALGLIALALPEVLGMGFDLLRDVTLGEQAIPLATLVLILIARLVTTAMCLGLGFVGGVFAPAMVLGALVGAIFGHGMEHVAGLPIVDASAYAICGMVAVTAPVIGAPVTAVIIVMELTGSYALTLAALASVGISNLLVSRSFGRCLFDRQLRDRALDLSAGRNKAILESRDIGPLVSERFVAARDDAEVDAVRRRMLDARRGQAFLVDGRGIYQGRVRLEDLSVADPGQAAIELRDRDDIVMLEHLSLWRAMQRIRRFDGESVAVIDDDGRLVGALYVSRLVSQFLDIQTDLRGEEQLRPE
jgi:CIC family chloride channel protein